MHIQTEKDVSGTAAKFLREQAGLTQKEFWKSIGLTQSGGSRYEQGQTIPRPIRILLFVMYAAGLKIDATTEAGAAALTRLSHIQASENVADREQVGAKLLDAQRSIKQAQSVLASIH